MKPISKIRRTKNNSASQTQAYMLLQYPIALLEGDTAVVFLLEMLRQNVENKGYVPKLPHLWV